MIAHKNIQERISNLKAQLIVYHPFFGIFLANTAVIKEDTFPTAATDGVNIYYNESFFNQLTDPEVKAVLLHECLHVIYSHCDKKRRGIRHPKKWNYAIDYAINWEIKAMDKEKVKLPENIIIDGKPFNVLYDPKYKNMYAEDIYDALQDNLCNEEGLDIHIAADLDEDMQREIADRILSSYEATKDERLSPGITRVVNEIRAARVPWTRVLHRYIGNALAKDDYSYNTFNRRFLGQGLYLPGLRNYKCGTIVVVIDTSASIGAKEIGAMVSELRKIAGLVDGIILISCDDHVHSFETIRDMSNFSKSVKTIKGQGATDFRPPFAALKEKRIVPELMLYMTDGMGTFPDKKDVPYPTIWVMTSDVVAPFGRTLQMRL
jgi:predicted metal-dependent peptidase